MILLDIPMDISYHIMETCLGAMCVLKLLCTAALLRRWAVAKVRLAPVRCCAGGPEPCGTSACNLHLALHRNLPKLCGTFQNPPETSGTPRNLNLPPAPAHTGAYLG